VPKVIWFAFEKGWEVRRHDGKLYFTYIRKHGGRWLRGKQIVLPPELSKKIEVVK